MSGIVVLRSPFKSYQILPETFTYLLLFTLEVLIFALAWFYLLHPLVMTLILIIYFVLIHITRFSPWLGHPLTHFLRPIHGIIISSLLLAEIVYFFTWISEGFTDSALIRSQNCVVITFFMLLWAFFAGITLLGLYFTYSTIAIWFVWFVKIGATFNTPFILYIAAIFVSLIGLGVWFTLTRFLRQILLKKEDYGEKQPAFFRWAIVISLISLFLGIGIISCENILSNYLISHFMFL